MDGVNGASETNLLDQRPIALLGSFITLCFGKDLSRLVELVVHISPSQIQVCMKKKAKSSLYFSQLILQSRILQKHNPHSHNWWVWLVRLEYCPGICISQASVWFRQTNQFWEPLIQCTFSKKQAVRFFF